MSRLYVVATPIGNLGDISARALQTLEAVDLIAAEDTRHSLKLLNHFEIRKPLISCHLLNERSRAPQIVEKMLGEDLEVALITDAGTPAVSDPGALLVRAAIAAGLEVLAVPGPSAAIAALSISGFDNTQFTFLGFPPRERTALRQALAALSGHTGSAVFHESPHRVEALLTTLQETLGDVPVSLSCDLTKRHELTLRGPLTQVLAAFQANEKAEKGEYVLVADLSATQAAPDTAPPALCLEARLLDLMLAGQGRQDAMAALLAQGEKKNTIYAASLRLKRLLRENIDEELT